MEESKLSAQDARIRLERAGRISTIHWVVIGASLGLTLFAWRYSAQEHNKLVQQRFEQQATQVIDLIGDRMQKYEDALWAGTALIRTNGDYVDHAAWERYANSIGLESKYPGINGIGVIHAVSKAELPAYLEEQRKLRPDYGIHPEHDNHEFMPITYIIPVEGNEKAVGLDMAHETNRYTAAKKARDTGLAQITGPIVLVQDSGKTPGFLFYAPFYAGGKYDTVAERQEHFLGLVYAPFVVKKLMEGTLAEERRQVGVRISDGDEILYDELTTEARYYDAEPMFSESVILPLYGREWTVDIQTASSFREVNVSNQPAQILVAGIVIEALIITLIVFLRRTAREAMGYAEDMTAALEARTLELEKLNEDLSQSNRDLDDFAHIASHDLKEPLRGINNYSTFLLEDYGDQLDEEAKEKLNTLQTLAKRLSAFIDDLFQYSRVGREQSKAELCNMQALTEGIIDTLKPWTDSEGGRVEIEGDLPIRFCYPIQMELALRNLITNGIKYNESAEKRVWIGCTETEGRGPVFYVRDNGIGIDEKHHENIFRIFKRLHGRESFGGGTGAGLTVTRKVLERHNGQIWLESEPEKGTTFYFSWSLTEGRQHGA
jgi:signal transduction histidine kinase